MARKTRDIYRDTATGRFASKATWQRSKSQGGERYVRERIPVKKAIQIVDDLELLLDLIDAAEDFEEIELGGAFDSPGGKKK